jgi:hypothetical protein
MFGVADCVADRIGFAVPEPTEWQRIGDEIDAASYRCAGVLRKRVSVQDSSMTSLPDHLSFANQKRSDGQVEKSSWVTARPFSESFLKFLRTSLP